MKRIWILLTLTILTTPLSAWLIEPTDETKEMVAPYLIPEDHPVKPILDEIFSVRASETLTSLRKAGFMNLQPRKRGLIVTEHPSLPGYIIKVYCDYSGHSYNQFTKSYQMQDEHLEFVGRLEKRNLIESIIDHYGFEEFILPKKWIYPIPTEVNPLHNHTRIKKFYLIVAEKLDILDPFETREIWKQVDQDYIHKFFLVYRDARLQDVGSANQCFTPSGHLAFIDTKDWSEETFKPLKSPYFLPYEHKMYWNQLIKSTFPE